MANVNTKAHVLVRDGFVCQTCGGLLFLSQAIKALDWHAPGLELWDLHGRKEPLRTCWATVDHLLPEIEGGMDVLENLVACCVTCNSSKGGTAAGAPADRRIVPGWDGLSSCFLGLVPRYADRLSSEDRKWQQALQRESIEPRTDLIDAVSECLERAKKDESSSGLESGLLIIFGGMAENAVEEDS